MSEFRLIGVCRVGSETLLDEGVVIGYPSKANILARRDFTAGSGSSVGARCILRCGTVVYEDVVIGDDVQTAHHVVLATRAGDRSRLVAAFRKIAEAHLTAPSP